MFASAKRRLAAALIAAAAAAAGSLIATGGAGPAFGVDFGWGGPSCAAMQQAHASFAASYLSFDPSKDFTRPAVEGYHRCGVATVVVWETGATEAELGFASGRSDAAAAALKAARLGEPSSRPIFFAIDCDCTGQSVASYFDGARSVLGARRTGAYGGIRPISYLFDTRRISYGWQTYAWSGGRWDPRAKLRQYSNSHLVGGRDVDYDHGYGDYGQFPYRVAPARAACFGAHARRTRACSATLAKVTSLERAAASSERAYVARGCPVLSQRAGWFSAALHRRPRVRAASRRRALGASRRAYRQRGCPVLRARDIYFSAHADALIAENT